MHTTVIDQVYYVWKNLQDLWTRLKQQISLKLRAEEGWAGVGVLHTSNTFSKFDDKPCNSLQSKVKQEKNYESYRFSDGVICT